MIDEQVVLLFSSFRTLGVNDKDEMLLAGSIIPQTLRFTFLLEEVCIGFCHLFTFFTGSSQLLLAFRRASWIHVEI